MTVKVTQLLVGVGILLAAVISYGRSVARRNLIVRAETELAAEGDQLRGRIEAGAFRSSYELNAALERIRQESTLEILSIQMRGPDGAVVARAGSILEPAFPAGPVRPRLQGTLPDFKVRRQGTDTVLVEAVAVELPVSASSGKPKTWLREVVRKNPNRVAVVEIAARLRPGRTLFPIHSRRPLFSGLSRLS